MWMNVNLILVNWVDLWDNLQFSDKNIFLLVLMCVYFRILLHCLEENHVCFPTQWSLRAPGGESNQSHADWHFLAATFKLLTAALLLLHWSPQCCLYVFPLLAGNPIHPLSLCAAPLTCCGVNWNEPPPAKRGGVGRPRPASWLAAAREVWTPGVSVSVRVQDVA